MFQPIQQPQPRMLARTWPALALALMLVTTLALRPAWPAAHNVTREAVGPFPLAFIPNAGQVTAPVTGPVRFTAYSPAGAIFFRDAAVELALPDGVLTVQFLGAGAQTTVAGVAPLPGRAGYYLGDDPSGWHESLPTFHALAYTALYDGVDLHYDGSEGLLKGTYTVAPGVDPAVIRWHYAGADDVRIGATGDLYITLPTGARLVEHAPVAFQVVDGAQVAVPVRYQVHGDTLGFAVGSYDRSLPLVIDPTLVYSSYLGGNSEDHARDVAVDAAGNVYVTGLTHSTSFPGGVSGNAGYDDLFVTKINAAGTAILYTAIIGGEGSDEPGGIAVNADGSRVWVVGETTSDNFPTLNGFQNAPGGSGDAYVLQLDGAGALAFSSYYGGELGDAAKDVALDSRGDVHMVGALWGGFFAKVDAERYELVYSRMIEGQEAVGHAIALDAGDNIYITGEIRSDSWPVVDPVQATCGRFDEWTCSTDAFVVKLPPTGDDLLFSTYLGGSADNGGSGTDIGHAIAVDASGNIAVSGATFAGDFPVVNAVQAEKAGANNISEAFVVRLAAVGEGYVPAFSTYLGGDGSDMGYAVAMAAGGEVMVAGLTDAQDFPVVEPWQPALGAGVCSTSTSRNCSDAFLSRFAPDGSLRFSTFWGGTDDDHARGMALHADGTLYVVGTAESTGFPVTEGGFQPVRGQSDEAFVLKLTLDDAPPPQEPATQVYLPLVQNGR